MMKTSVERAQEQFVALPKDASALAAGLVRYTEFCSGVGAAINNRVYLTYSYLASVTDELGLEAEDMLLMHVYLDRFRAAAPAAAAELGARDQLLIAAYLSQALMYDEPLHKTTWLKFAGATTWAQFLERVLCVCDVIHYEFYVAPNVFAQSYQFLLSFNIAEAVRAEEEQRKLVYARRAAAAAAQRTSSTSMKIKLSRDTDGTWTANSASAVFDRLDVEDVVPVGL